MIGATVCIPDTGFRIVTFGGFGFLSENHKSKMDDSVGSGPNNEKEMEHENK